MTLPPPLSPFRCTNPDCAFPEGGRCARSAEFPDPALGCPELARTAVEDVSAAEGDIQEPASSSTQAPWSGRHLHPGEAEALIRRSQTRVLAVLGPYGAGKTCLLTSFFLQLASGQRGPLNYRFSSCRTLHGFRELAEHASRWRGDEGEIVDRTPTEEKDRPGSFLHLGLRPSDPDDDRQVDVLLSDVAGEWISNWSEQAEGAHRKRMGFLVRSDGFLVLVDAAGLLGSSGSNLDSDTAMLLRRVGDLAQHASTRRSIALVLSKYDRIDDRVPLPPPEERLKRDAWGELGRRTRRIWGALDEVQRRGFHTGIFPVSAFPCPLAEGQPYGVMDPFAFVLGHADRRSPWPRRILPVPEGARSFAAMRRWEIES